MADGPASGFVFKPSRDWGRDAHGYFQEYNQQLKAYTEPREKADKSPKILVMGHEARGDDPIAPQIHEWADLFYNNGYEYRVGYSQSFKPAANSRSHDKVIDWSYIEGARRDRPKVHIVYGREVGTRGWTNGGSWVYGKGDMGLKDIQKEVEG
jgi:hypothetical protein